MNFWKIWCISKVVTLAFVFALVFYKSAYPQDGGAEPQNEPTIHHHEGMSEAIDKFYSTWRMPDEPMKSCCDKVDCYPTSFKKVGDRYFFLRREDQQWIPIPPGKLEQTQTNHISRESPDGRNHVCAPAPSWIYKDGEQIHDPNDKRVYCAVLGSGT